MVSKLVQVVEGVVLGKPLVSRIQPLTTAVVTDMAQDELQLGRSQRNTFEKPTASKLLLSLIPSETSSSFPRHLSILPPPQIQST